MIKEMRMMKNLRGNLTKEILMIFWQMNLMMRNKDVMMPSLKKEMSQPR